jgi:hypothetical protein
MSKTFKAFLQNGHLEWIDGGPALGDERLQVYVTVLENSPIQTPQTHGERMSEILNHLAAIDGLESVDPVLWQREIRGDRSLPER